MLETFEGYPVVMKGFIKGSDWLYLYNLVKINDEEYVIIQDNPHIIGKYEDLKGRCHFRQHKPGYIYVPGIGNVIQL